jgi:hypothetical protein
MRCGSAVLRIRNSPQRHRGTERTGDEAAYSILQHWNIEVDEEAERFAGQTKVGKQLRIVNRQNPRYCFELHHHIVFDEKINLQVDANTSPFINDRYGKLSDDPEFPEPQFNCEAFLINTLEKTGPKRPMNFDRSPYDPLCNLILRHLRASVSLW